MATKLFLRASENSGIAIGGSLVRDLSTTAGARARTAVVQVVSGDVVNSERQFFKNSTKTQLLTFVSQPVAAGFTLAGVITFSIWGLEGSMNNNAGLRCKIGKRTAAGATTLIGTFDDNVEMGTSFGEMTWTGTPTSTAFAVGDRIVLQVFTDIVGANAGATADCQIQYNGADATSGDSFIQLTENVSFSANAALGTFFQEEFETSPGRDEVWSLGDTTSGGATIDDDYPAGAGCSGSESARHVVGAGDFCRMHHDFGEKRTLYGRVQFYIESRTDPLNAFHPLLSIGSREDEGAPAIFLAHLVRRGAGNPIGLEVDMWHNGGVNQIPAAVPVLLNERYQIEWKWDLATATWEVWLNGVSLGSGAITGTGLNSVPSFISLGSGTFAPADFDVTYQTDMVALSDSARIGYVPCGGITHDAAVSYSGRGQIGGGDATTVIRPAAVSLSGVGDFDAAAVQTHAARVEASGAGAFDASAVQTHTARVEVSGAGDFDAAAVQTHISTFAATGAGSFDVDATVLRIAQLSLTGIGLFEASAIQDHLASASFEGAGLFSAAGEIAGGPVTHTAAASFSGIGAFAAAGEVVSPVTHDAAASFSGVGIFDAAATLVPGGGPGPTPGTGGLPFITVPGLDAFLRRTHEASVDFRVGARFQASGRIIPFVPRIHRAEVAYKVGAAHEVSPVAIRAGRAQYGVQARGGARAGVLSNASISLSGGATFEARAKLLIDLEEEEMLIMGYLEFAGRS